MAITSSRREQLWQESGISPAERQRCTFPSFRVSANPEMRGPRDAAERWGEGDGTPFLVLQGQRRGTGKTHLALAAAARCVERGEPVRCVVVPEFLDRLRASYRSEDESLLSLRAEAEQVDALVLDDLGAGKPTEWAEEQLCTLVNARWKRSLRTLVTSNPPVFELEERIASRLMDRRVSLVIACSGSDYRLRSGR